jgi:hypothetical protein
MYSGIPFPLITKRNDAPPGTRLNVYVMHPSQYDRALGAVIAQSVQRRGSIPGRAKWISSIPQRPDRPWVLLRLLSNGY